MIYELHCILWAKCVKNETFREVLMFKSTKGKEKHINEAKSCECKSKVI